MEPHRYAIGIDQDGQSTPQALGGARLAPRTGSNVTIDNVLFRRIRATLGERTKSRHGAASPISYGGLFACNAGRLACRGIDFDDVTLSGVDTKCVFENTFGSGTAVHPDSCVPPGESTRIQ